MRALFLGGPKDGMAEEVQEAPHRLQVFDPATQVMHTYRLHCWGEEPNGINPPLRTYNVYAELDLDPAAIRAGLQTYSWKLFD